MEKKIEKKGTKLILPVDHLAAKGLETKSKPKIFSNSNFTEEYMAFDIGPKTISEFSTALPNAKTVFWNGPLGVFEQEAYAKGTMSIAQTLASLDAYTVVGGGDSALALKKSGLADKVRHISTGGGASLEFLEGRKFPGLVALNYY